jgi:hypothetical protein
VTILYARVSTADQTLDHQLTQARAAGFVINEVMSDHGVSGVSTRLAEREQARRLFDSLRRGDTLVVRWVDRLGRNYADVVDTMRGFLRRGVIVKTVINSMVFDGSTADPMLCAGGMRSLPSWPTPRRRRPRRPNQRSVQASTMRADGTLGPIAAAGQPTHAISLFVFWG